MQALLDNSGAGSRTEAGFDAGDLRAENVADVLCPGDHAEYGDGAANYEGQHKLADITLDEAPESDECFQYFTLSLLKGCAELGRLSKKKSR